MSDKKVTQVRLAAFLVVEAARILSGFSLTFLLAPQYDIRSGEVTQEYNQHLGPVNTITFVDENRRFVTTSDDKTMRVWDFDIPVPIKLIADPSMHSMPAVGLDSKGKWLAATSLDNQIVLFGADTFKQNVRRLFLPLRRICLTTGTDWVVNLCHCGENSARSDSRGTRSRATRASRASRPTGGSSRRATDRATSSFGTSRRAGSRAGCSARTSRSCSAMRGCRTRRCVGASRFIAMRAALADVHRCSSLLAVHSTDLCRLALQSKVVTSSWDGLIKLWD